LHICQGEYLLMQKATLIRKLRTFVELLGIATIGGSLFLTIFILIEIAFNGVFIGYEDNIIILFAEILLIIIGIIYSVFLFYWRLKNITPEIV